MTPANLSLEAINTDETKNEISEKELEGVLNLIENDDDTNNKKQYETLAKNIEEGIKKGDYTFPVFDKTYSNIILNKGENIDNQDKFIFLLSLNIQKIEQNPNISGNDLSWDINSDEINVQLKNVYEKYEQNITNLNTARENLIDPNNPNNIRDKILYTDIDLSYLSKDNIKNITFNQDGKKIILSGEQKQGKKTVTDEVLLDLGDNTTNFSDIEKQAILMKIKSELLEFVTYFPDPTKRLNNGTLDGLTKSRNIKKNVDFKKESYTIANTLLKKDNETKILNGTFDLDKFSKGKNETNVNEAFSIFIAQEGNNINKIAKNRKYNSKIVKKLNDLYGNTIYSSSIGKKLEGGTLLLYNGIREKIKGSNNAIKTDTQNNIEYIDTKFIKLPDSLNKLKNSDGYMKDLQNIKNSITSGKIKSDNIFTNGLTVEQKNFILNTIEGQNMLIASITKKVQENVNEQIGDNENIKKAMNEYQDSVDENIKGVKIRQKIKATLKKALEKQPKDLNNGETSGYVDKETYNKLNEIQYNGRGMMGGCIDSSGYLNVKEIGGKQYYKVRLDKNEMYKDQYTKNMNMQKSRVKEMIELKKGKINSFVAKIPDGNGKTQDIDMIKLMNGELNDGKKTINSPFFGPTMKLDFSKNNENSTMDDNVENIIRDSLWEKTGDTIKEDYLTRWQSFENKQYGKALYELGHFGVDMASIIGAGIITGAIDIGSSGGTAVGSGVIFTATQEAIKTGGYEAIETIKYGFTGDKNGGYSWRGLTNAAVTGAGKGLGLYEQTTNVYGDTSYKTDENGNLVMKDWETIATEQGLNLLNGIVLMGPIGKIGDTITPILEEGLITEGVDEVVGKTVTNLTAKSVGLLADAGGFTLYNNLISYPLSSGVMTMVKTGDLSQSFKAFGNTLGKGLTGTNMIEGFIDNMIFISLLKAGGGNATTIQRVMVKTDTRDQYNKALNKQQKLINNIKDNPKRQEKGFQLGVDTKTNKLVIVDKNNNIITDDDLTQAIKECGLKYKYLVETNQLLNGLQQQVVIQQNNFIKNNEAAKEYYDFINDNDLNHPEIGSPEDIINKKIKEYTNKNNTAKVKEWKDKLEKFKELSTSYNELIQKKNSRA